MTFVRGHHRQTPSGRTIYVRPHHRQSRARQSTAGLDLDPGLFVVVLVLLALLVGGALVVWLVEFIASNIAALILGASSLGALAGVCYVVVAGVQHVRARKVARYLDLCHTLTRGARLSQADSEELHALGLRLPVDLQARVVGEERLFEGFIAAILADGRVDEREAQVLEEVQGLFSIDVARAEMIKFAAFDGLLEALGGALDEEAEVMVCEVSLALGLPLEEVVARLQPLVDRREAEQRDAIRAAEQQLASERREAQRRAALERELQLVADILEAEHIEAIEASVRLAKREQAYYETPAVEVKRFKKGDRRQSGALVITDRRLLFVGDGNIDIPWAKLLDVAADCDEGLLRLIKDGRKTPYYFEIERPRVALAHVERGLARGV